MTTEPARLVSLINAALTATLSVLVVVDVLDEDVAAALGFALAAWILVAGEFLRSRVTPVGNARLTSEQAQKVEIIPTAVVSNTTNHPAPHG